VSQEEEPDDDAHEGIRVGLETTKALHEQFVSLYPSS
jgi:hypothetical protein